MNNLETYYLGLRLKSPLIMASSRLSARVDNSIKAEESGAGAIVLRSLFEEQIIAEMSSVGDSVGDYHPEALDYYKSVAKNYKVQSYLDLISQTKDAVSIPVIASLHCVHKGEWVEYASKLEKAGADALELNVYIKPEDIHSGAQSIEEHYYDILKDVKKHVDIPVSMKIPPYFTNIYHVVSNLDKLGVAGVVLFNRFFRFDIDIDKVELIAGEIFSTPDEISLPMRWISRLHGKVKTNIAASTGVHDGAGLIKQLLVGADAVQVASVLYQKNVEHMSTMLDELNRWMEAKGFNYIDEFRGKLAKVHSKDPIDYEREQFIRKDMEN